MQQGAGGRLDGRFHHHTALSRPSWLLMLLTAVCACDGGRGRWEQLSRRISTSMKDRSCRCPSQTVRSTSIIEWTHAGRRHIQSCIPPRHGVLPRQKPAKCGHKPAWRCVLISTSRVFNSSSCNSWKSRENSHYEWLLSVVSIYIFTM